MAKIPISEALKLLDVSRSTLYRDIDNGKVSASADESGKKVVDTAELVRVYGELDMPSHSENGTGGTPTLDNLGQHGTNGKGENSNVGDANNAVIAVLEEQVAFLKEQLDNATDREAKLMDMLSAEQEKTRMLMLPSAASKSRRTWRNFFRLT